MPESTSEMWLAYVDESESYRHLDPDTYLLAAAVLTEGVCESTRQVLRRLLLRGQRKLHWHDESPTRRRRIINALAELDVLNVVVVRAGVAGERSERRRRQCLERLLHELAASGVEQVHLEARQERQNQRDRALLDTLRSRQVVPGHVRVEHCPGPSEPLLWLPDAVCGAVTADRCAEPRYLKSLQQQIEVHHIGP